MEPAVPFALLGVVQLVSFAAWLGVAGVAVARGRQGLLIGLGAGLLAAVEVVTAVSYGNPSSDPLALLRVVGLGLLAVGLGVLSAPVAAAGPAALVVPLGAASAPAMGGVLAGLLAAGVGVRAFVRRGRPLLAVFAGLGLVLTAAACGASSAAGSSFNWALAVLALRAGAAACLLGVVVALAAYSVLAKVVGAMLAGVVVMAAGAVGIVGSGVANDVQAQQTRQVASVGRGQVQTLVSLRTQATQLARLVAICAPSPRLCPPLLGDFAVYPGYFAVAVGRHGVAQLAGSGRLPPAALQLLAGTPSVASVLSGAPEAADFTVLPTAPQSVVALGVAPGYPTATHLPDQKPSFAAVYGVPLNAAYVRAVSRQIAYDVTVIAGGHVLVSTLGSSAAHDLLLEGQRSGLGSSLLSPSSGLVVPANGRQPTAAFFPLVSAGNDALQVATLAISQPARVALRPSESVLTRVFLTAIAVLLVVAAFALLLGRRIVQPVQRLTAAAGRVRRGDLYARSRLRGRDEVAGLGLAFDSMTSSLQELTGQLRDAADQESALRTRLETVLDSMSDGVVATDQQCRVTALNPLAAVLLGVDPLESVGEPLSAVADLRSMDGAPLLGPPLEPGYAEGLAHRAGGVPVPVGVGVARLGDGRGTVVVLRDMTREREIERMKTEFLSNVSHELRTPLTPIRGYAEILHRRPNLPATKVSEYVDMILESTTRMTRVVDLLVDVAALDAGRVVPSACPIDVGALVDERLAEWRARWPDRAADFKRRVAARLPSVLVDPKWLGRGLDELADNAVKYTPPGTAIQLAASLTADRRSVRLTVRDAGPGIPSSRLDELLGDFVQADSSATRRVGGLGLGLAFARRLAEHLSVRLVAESAEGRGSAFGFDVPVAPTVPTVRRHRAPGRQAARAGSGGRRAPG
jgi:signal transduction histidine kinase